MTKNNNIYVLFTLSFFTLIFPIAGFFLILGFYLYIKPSKLEKAIIYIGLTYAIAFIAYRYVRTNATGDVVIYGYWLQGYRDLDQAKLLKIDGWFKSYQDDKLYYPVWDIFLQVIGKFLGLQLQHLNWLAAVSIFSANLYIIFSMSNIYMNKNIDKILVFKFFLFYSFIILFSSYKNMWAFSWFALGIYEITMLNKKKLGSLFIILGIGIHPACIIPLFAFLLSYVFDFKKYYIGISLFIGIIFKFVPQIFKLLSFSSFLYAKVNSYIYGKWAKYRFNDKGEYVFFVLILLAVIFIGMIFLLDLYKEKDSTKKQSAKDFYRYNNFIAWYFCLALILVFYRTFGVRLFYDGFIFFIPLFFQVFKNYNFFEKKILSWFILIIWFLMIDIRTFNIFNSSYQIGSGFPSNLLDSPIILFFTN